MTNTEIGPPSRDAFLARASDVNNSSEQQMMLGTNYK